MSQRPPVSGQRVRPALHQLLDATGNVPALLLGRRTDVLAGNRLVLPLLADFPTMPATERNLTRWIILDPLARSLFREWKTVASDAVGSLRVDIGGHHDHPEASQLVGELAVSSEHPRKWWAGPRVAKASAGIARPHHPVVGNLELNVEDLVLPDDPDQTLRVYSAPPGSSSADSLALLGSFGAGTGTPEPAQAPEERDGSDATKTPESRTSP